MFKILSWLGFRVQMVAFPTRGKIREIRAIALLQDVRDFARRQGIP